MMFGLRDWICSGCGRIKENVKTDVGEVKCPDCGIQMTKIFSPPLVLFKGTGWTPNFHGGTSESKD